MFNNKILISLVIFSIFMIITSIVKTQTRIIEKKIFTHEKKINAIKNNIYEAQLDFYYLTSPDYISKKIHDFSEHEYFSIKYSQIYFNLEHFLKNNLKTVKKVNYEK